ncbi:MAG: alpha/beta hydrolase fold domain-containing protein [Paludibacter sp.]|nr:alpha/beta hydrolase fold domain-containing protein [Paludibacter sp.]
MKKLFFLILLFYVSFGDFCFGITPTFSNVNYVGDGNSKHLLDVYVPAGVVTPTKTIVYIHGGGWQSGSKSKTMDYCQKLYDAGYIVVGVDYRLSSDSIFPAQIFDCKTAIRFLKKNADTYKIDSCNIGVIGSSAGGHLATLLGTSIGESSLEGLHLGRLGATSKVHAVADFFGPTDFLKMDSFPSPLCKNPMIHDIITSAESRLLGCLISSCPEKVRQANPITYINGNEPPFMIHHGNADCLVSIHQSIILHDSLIAHNQISSLTIYPDGGHGSFVNTSVLDSMEIFFNNTLVNKCNETGLTELTEKFSINIFPNPVHDIAYIQSELQIDKNEIFNLTGDRLIVTSTGNQVNVSQLIKGLYIIQVNTADGLIAMKRLIKI